MARACNGAWIRSPRRWAARPWLSGPDYGAVSGLGRPAIASRQRFAGVQQALQARQNEGPAAGYGVDELRAVPVHLVGDGQFHRVTVRFELEGRARIAFGFQLRPEFVVPGKHQA